MSPRLARLLLRGFPRAWRRRYGEEYAALLEQHPPGWRPVASTVLLAARTRHAHHRGAMTWLLGLALFVAAEVTAVRQGLTVNIFWLPRSPQSAVILAAAVLGVLVMTRPLLGLGPLLARLARRLAR